MKIVIDIPDYEYRQIKEYYEKNDTVEALYGYIYHGIPLPKGHGYLVDYEELKNNAREYGAYAEATLSHIKPKVIIEADKAESEDK